MAGGRDRVRCSSEGKSGEGNEWKTILHCGLSSKCDGADRWLMLTVRSAVRRGPVGPVGDKIGSPGLKQLRAASP